MLNLSKTVMPGIADTSRTTGQLGPDRFGILHPQTVCDRLSGWLHTIPLYRRTGPAVVRDQLRGGNSGQLNRLPMITKADIRRGFPHNFLSPEHNLEELMESQLLELEHTSGTSEERTPLLLPYGWWEWQEAGALRLNRMVSAALAECSPARRVVLAPPTCNSTISYLQVPTRAQRTVGEALHLALSKQPFLWSDADLDRMVAEATEWRPVFLDLNPTFGVCFARHCERRGIRFPELRFILSSYEYLSVVHRRILERVFGVPVCNLYGATETGHLLMEDDPGELILVEVTVTTVIAVCGECWLGLFVGGFRESPSWAMFFSVRRHTFSG